MIEKREVEFAKEIDDVAVLLVELVKDIKAKKGAAEIAGENVKNLMDAIAAFDQIPAEAKNKLVALQTLGYRTGELAAVIVG